ncbi:MULTISPECIES: hypothetical protein [Bradyrhizobium]|uniref:Transposase n=1 Tax=Bradyrhizobium vignae TaxID=1549949 RepID=A0ABS4A878_9BRAD|nr:hypothetical protein [Bradyrhizobium vignae]MBP0116476.1 hypothetical protein [Bradyrhizobium vignae]
MHSAQRIARRYECCGTETEKLFWRRNLPGSASEASSNARARFWFQLVETMIRNHIDERQLNAVE